VTALETSIVAPSTAPVAHLTRRYRFSASHRLHCGDMTDEQNRSVFGKCNNPHGHGHNYIVDVTVAGPVDAATGMVCNLVDLDALAERQILTPYDHRNLNALPQFAKCVPTTENLAVIVFNSLAGDRAISGIAARLVGVRVEETGNNAFEYTGNGTNVETQMENRTL
jgi:6-pyruvoyltetrahydropterin/6-carboxytetrahydropterin synthase